MDEVSEDVSRKLETQYVKNTYDSIAEDFSNTRHKKWPKVDEFLKSLPEYSLLLDVGCGNGKYLNNESTFNIGIDISANLLSICKGRGFEVVQCDMTRIPFRNDIFDTIICVASLHHIVTAKRREMCVQKMLNSLIFETGRLLVQVWSYEQELDKSNPYLKKTSTDSIPSTEYTRELPVSGELVIPVHKNRTPFRNQDLLIPFHSKQTVGEDTKLVEQLRYYHLFKEKELDTLLLNVDDATVMQSYHDRGNWCSIVKKNLPIQ